MRTENSSQFLATGYTSGYNFEVYPNPTTDTMRITFESTYKQDIRVEVVTEGGKIIYSERLRDFIGTYRTAVDLFSSPKGVYFVLLYRNDRVMVGKITHQ